MCSVCSVCVLGGGVELLIKFCKKGGGLTGSQFLEEVAGKEGVIFFRGVGAVFKYIKNKLTFEIFNYKKKFINKNVFLSVVTKNLNWEIVTKNLVTFKRWDGVKNEKLEYYGGSLKNLVFRGGSQKPICRGQWPKGGEGLGKFVDLKGGGVFEGRVDTPHTMLLLRNSLYIKMVSRPVFRLLE